MLVIKWNDMEYKNSFTVNFLDFNSNVTIEQGEIGKIYINGTLILNVPTLKPLFGEVHGIKIDEDNNDYLDNNITDEIPYIRYTYSKSGSASSIPGTSWEETDEFKLNARESLENCKILDNEIKYCFGKYLLPLRIKESGLELLSPIILANVIKEEEGFFVLTSKKAS